MKSSPKRTWSYPLYRILRLEVCPSGGGPSKSFNTAAPRFPGGTQKRKASSGAKLLQKESPESQNISQSSLTRKGRCHLCAYLRFERLLQSKSNYSLFGRRFLLTLRVTLLQKLIASLTIAFR